MIGRHLLNQYRFLRKEILFSDRRQSGLRLFFIPFCILSKLPSFSFSKKCGIMIKVPAWKGQAKVFDKFPPVKGQAGV